MNGDETTRTSWGTRYVGIALLLLGLSVASIWYFVGYRQQSFNALLSFRVDDGWCTKGVQSIGAHCFGDYTSMEATRRTGRFWDPLLPTATPYPPLSLVPPLLFLQLGRLTGSWAFGRDLYLVALAASLLSPAVWVSRKGWWERGPAALLIIGVASAPFLVIMDRGNTTGLLVAPLLGVATSLRHAQHRRMVAFIVICTLLKPQMILLALLFLTYRAFAYLATTVAISAFATISGFLFFPGSISDNFSNWLKLAHGYQLAPGFSDPYPYNLGIGRSLLTFFDVSHLQAVTGPSTRSALALWLQHHSSLLALALIGLLILTVLAQDADSNPLFPFLAVCILVAIAPGTSYPYYLVLLLVPAALVLRDPYRAAERGSAWSGMLDTYDAATPRWLRVSCGTLVVGIAVLLSPLVVPISSVPLLFSEVPKTVPVGALQLLWGPLLLVMFFLTISIALLGTRRGRSANPTSGDHTLGA